MDFKVKLIIITLINDVNEEKDPVNYNPLSDLPRSSDLDIID